MDLSRQPSGRFYRARTVVSWGLLGFLFSAPFVDIGGQPLMMLNVLERRFVLFGMLFRPQDFHLVVLVALTVLVTLALSTVTIGRVWCGWLCPQTVFMEMLFRKLEYPPRDPRSSSCAGIAGRGPGSGWCARG